MRGTHGIGVSCIALFVVQSWAFGSACSNDATSPAPAPVDAGDAAADVVHGGSSNDWSCVGKVVLPAAPASPLVVDLFLGGLADGKGISGLKVRACSDRGDAPCAAGSPAKTTGSDGRALFDVAASFDGYFEAVEAGEMTNLHYVPLPVVNTPHIHGRAQWRSTELRLVAEELGITIDPAKGHILVQAQDCRSRSFPAINPLPVDPDALPVERAGGVTLTLDPLPAGVTPGYIVTTPKLRVRKDATETADGIGDGGFLNVPPGVYKVTGTRAATGEKLGTQRVVVRADTNTMLILTPRP